MPGVSVPYQLNITTSSGVKSFPIRRDGFNLSRSAGKAGKHTTSSCKISVRGSSILSQIMYADGLLEATVTNSSGDVIFTGVIRPYASITAEPMYLGDLQLEVLDYTEKMHKKVYAKITNENDEDDDSAVVPPPSYKDGTIFEGSWPEMKVCDPNDTEHSLVHQLCDLCGISASSITAPKIDVTLHRFSLEKGDYIDEVLGTLLYEFIHDYAFDENGGLYVYQTGTIIDVVYGSDGKVDESQTVRHTLTPTKTVTVFRNSLKIDRSDDDTQGALVEYKKYKTQEDVRIGRFTDQGNSGLVSGGADLTDRREYIEWDLSEIEDDGGEDIVLSNFWLTGRNTSSWIAGCSATKKELVDYDQKGGTIVYRLRWGGGLYGQWKYTFEVYADVSYYKDETRTVGYAGDNAEEYRAQYIETLEDALCLATALQDRTVQGSFSYTFDSFEELEPGDVVTLDESVVSGLETVARITKRTLKDDTGLYSYEAEGYGEAEFRAPDLDRDEDPNLPQNQPDFLLLEISEDNILPSTEDNEPIYATASGMLFDKYGATPEWRLNGNVMESVTDLSIQFSKLMLAPGSNRLRVSGVYEGETYYAERIINYISSDIDIQMQFAIVPEGQSPDSSTVWQDTQPTPGANEDVWLRFRTSSSGNWIVIRMTAEDGGDPLVYFQWAATPYVAPDEGVDLLTWDDMAITWETDGDVMGFILDSGRWETLVPDKPFGLNYLWVKYWSYQEEQWDYFCTTGTPAMDFNLIVNPQTFKLTSRGVTQESKVYNDKLQRINVRCQRLNTTAPVSWTVTPEDESLLSWERVNDADDSEIVIMIQPMVSLQTITIECSIADIDVSKEFVVSGIQEGKAEMMYMGVIDSTATFPSYTSEGPLIVGDHVLVEGEDGNRTPYYWTGTEWKMADSTTPSSVTFEILQNVLYDATHSPGTIDSQSIVNLFAQNFAAYSAFVYNLMARNLLVGSGSATSGFRFEAYDYQDGENVTPVIRVRYNGRTVFQIDPATGNVFFGQPNSALTAPSSGFMYRASDQSIVSVGEKLKISSGGTIELVGATIKEANIESLSSVAGLNALGFDIEAPEDGATVSLVASSTIARTIFNAVEYFVPVKSIGQDYINCHFLNYPCAARYARIYNPTDSSYAVDFYTATFEKIPDSYWEDFYSIQIIGSSSYSLYYDSSSGNAKYWGRSMGDAEFHTGSRIEMSLPGAKGGAIPSWIDRGQLYYDENGFVKLCYWDTENEEQ